MEQKHLDAPFYNLLEHRGGRLLEESATGKMALLEESALLMLRNDSEDEALAWLEKHANSGWKIVDLMGETTIRAWKRFAPDMPVNPTIQFVWTDDNPPAEFEEMRYRTSYMPDYKWVRDRYDLVDDDELRHIIEDGDLDLAFEDEEPAGFAGIHREGSMGMLEVFEDYRRKGYAREMESRLIAKVLERGMIPYADIFADNDLSIHLQESLGLERAPMECAFSWKESEEEAGNEPAPALFAQ